MSTPTYLGVLSAAVPGPHEAHTPFTQIACGNERKVRNRRSDPLMLVIITDHLISLSPVLLSREVKNIDDRTTCIILSLFSSLTGTWRIASSTVLRLHWQSLRWFGVTPFVASNERHRRSASSRLGQQTTASVYDATYGL